MCALGPEVIEERVPLGVPGASESLAITTRSYSFGHAPRRRILVTAGLHGDEATSIGAVWYLERKLESALRGSRGKDALDGTVTVVRCANPLAAQVSSRLTPLEASDVNRSFPGRHDGSLAERTAAVLVRLLDRHDALVDVHTAGWCVPFILLDSIPGAALRARVQAWAAVAKFPVVNEMPASKAKLQGLDRSWSACAIGKKKPAFTMELPGFHTLEHRSAQRGGDALLELVRRSDLLVRRPANAPAPGSRRLPFRAEMFAAAAGLFEAVRRPGDAVDRGARIGWVKPLVGSTRDSHEVKATHAGELLALQPISAVYPGAWLATIAAAQKRAGRARAGPSAPRP